MKITSDLYIKITCALYEIVLIIFIEISAITNFLAGTFTHPPSKRLQNILSIKKFNDSAAMVMFVSRLRIFFPFHVEPCSFVSCLFFQPCILQLLKDQFEAYLLILKRIFPTTALSSSAVFNSLNFLLRSIFKQPSSTTDCNKERTEGKKTCF